MKDDNAAGNKVGRVLIMSREDGSLIGATNKGYDTHCFNLLSQLHEYHQQTGNIFTCVEVGREAYRRYLDGKRSQPEWLYDYFANSVSVR